jgi:hypothetical protein
LSPGTFFDFTAIYLVFILALSSISVLCTILVLNFNFGTDADPIPSTIRFFLVSVVARLICWKSKGCRPKRKVGNSDVELIDNPQPSDSMHKSDEADDESEEITWQDLSNILDRGFFMLFSVLIVLTTAMFIGVVFSERASS